MMKHGWIPCGVVKVKTQSGYSGWLDWVKDHLIFLFHKYIIFDLTITKTSKKVEGIKLIWSSTGQQGEERRRLASENEPYIK